MKHLIFITSLLTLTLLSCEKEPILLDTASEPTLEKNDNACLDDAYLDRFYHFDVCGTEYTLHVYLNMFNHQQFHYVQSVLRCYKAGGDPVADLVDFADLEMEVNGNIHILCDVPLTVSEPNAYDTHPNGEITNSYECNDCGYGVVTLAYSKDVTMLPGDQLKVSGLLEVDECGLTAKQYFDLLIEL